MWKQTRTTIGHTQVCKRTISTEIKGSNIWCWITPGRRKWILIIRHWIYSILYLFIFVLMIGNEPVGRCLWSPQDWRYLCEPTEKCQSYWQRSLTRKARCENIFAIQILILQAWWTFPTSSIQQILGYTNKCVKSIILK